jgi:hypothetical protein
MGPYSGGEEAQRRRTGLDAQYQDSEWTASTSGTLEVADSLTEQVSSIALSATLSHLAVGLGDGTVLVYRHLLQSLTTSPTSLTSLPKARVIHESPEPITGLGFREAKHPTQYGVSRTAETKTGVPAGPLLYICTTNRVLVGELSSRSGQAKSIDDLGCGLGCAVSDSEGKDMIVARDEGIYTYHPGGRGVTYAYEGETRQQTELELTVRSQILHFGVQAKSDRRLSAFHSFR